MGIIDNYQEAIWVTLLSEGPLTFNQLFLKTQKSKKCSRATFQKHLSQLVNDCGILKNKKGVQKIEYALPKNLSTNTKEIINMIDNYNTKFNEFDLELFVKSIGEHLKMEKSKQQHRKIYEQLIPVIEYLLKAIKVTTLATSLEVLGKMVIVKLNKLHKRCTLFLQKIMNVIRRTDSKIHLAINSKILYMLDLI